MPMVCLWGTSNEPRSEITARNFSMHSNRVQLVHFDVPVNVLDESERGKEADGSKH